MLFQNQTDYWLTTWIMIYWKANAVIIVFVCVRARAINTDFTLEIMNEKQKMELSCKSFVQKLKRQHSFLFEICMHLIIFIQFERVWNTVLSWSYLMNCLCRDRCFSAKNFRLFYFVLISLQMIYINLKATCLYF